MWAKQLLPPWNDAAQRDGKPPLDKVLLQFVTGQQFLGPAEERHGPINGNRCCLHTAPDWGWTGVKRFCIPALSIYLGSPLFWHQSGTCQRGHDVIECGQRGEQQEQGLVGEAGE